MKICNILTTLMSVGLMASADAFAPVRQGSFTSSTTPVLLRRPQQQHSSTTSTTLRMVADDAKVVLVTGSSRGLGKAIALEMGKAGQKVVVNYVSEGSKDAAEATCAEIKKLGGDAVAIQADSTWNDCLLVGGACNVWCFANGVEKPFRRQKRVENLFRLGRHVLLIVLALTILIMLTPFSLSRFFLH